ncbi:hypothetical protein [Shewanella putrefaciens]|uniref:Uncharacterized protein n=1 Tax=Shewanella putrefaciens (strain CN-32 / ATCC BAA-453) TaxID=319224 RepID=A4Y3W7_SHEPC|nr:hypothetical protein [Shewanella putrefaciens]
MAIAPKQDNCIVSCAVFIVIVSPVTRREYIPIGSTATSMSPTVTVATMPILTNPIAVRLAKKLLPQSVFEMDIYRGLAICICPQ